MTKLPRIGVDLGGTKIEAVVLDEGGRELARKRIAAPKNDYAATVMALSSLVVDVEQLTGFAKLPTGIGIPGGISKRTGLVHNANSTWLNGRNLLEDVRDALTPRPVAIANDANCFALSEATDGAGADAQSVFGVILGTGAGGGLVVDRKLIDGPHGIAGEWGHNPLPWPGVAEYPGFPCWCGRLSCMETWVSGPGLAADHSRMTGEALTAEAIASRARNGDAGAMSTLDRHASRLARGLAHVVNIFDPDVIVLGGGLSQLPHLYGCLPSLMRPHIFADDPVVVLRPPTWGDAGGVRGAAWLV